jgi:ribosomal-protein-alanine N-acetyltransferase
MTETMSASVSTRAAALFADLPTIETPRLILRKMTFDDAPAIFEYARDPRMSRYTVWDSPRSLQDTMQYLRCVVDSYTRGDPEDWGLVLKDGNRFIGTCGYFAWDRERRLAEIHYALSGAFSGNGLMSEAVCAVIRFGFVVMGLNRVEARCMPANAASERVMQKAGMRFEGIMRDGIYAKGKFNDLKVYALLRRDWDAAQPPACAESGGQ